MDHKLAARESDGKRPGKTRTTCTATTASLYSLVIARDAHGLLLYASCWRPELSDDGSPRSPVSLATAVRPAVLHQFRRRRRVATVASR
jgi:hypothetical protein